MKPKPAITLVVFFILLSGHSAVQAQAPQLINFQGKLNQGSTPPTGTFSMTFCIYPSATGGSSLWCETQNVTVTNGVFNVLLGSVTPFPANLFAGAGERHLGIKVGNDAEMSPRFQFASVAFALRAREVESLADNSVTSTKIQDGQVGTNDLANDAVTSAKIQNGSIIGDDIASPFSKVASAGGDVFAVRRDAASGDVINGYVQGSGTGRAGYFINENASNPNEVVYVATRANVGSGGLFYIQNPANNATAVYGETNTTSNGAAMFGQSVAASGWAGIFVNSNTSNTFPALESRAAVETNPAAVFRGRVAVVGALSKSSGAFKIDHPVDPSNKYLYHSFVESPDMMNVYNGNITLDGIGEAWVALPQWFQALNRDFRYQLTAIGAPGPNLYVAEEISANRFKIAGGQPDMKVSWQVTGIRQDAYANAHRIPVEEEKPLNERGHYLHPELYGKSKEMGVDFTPIPSVAPERKTEK